MGVIGDTGFSCIISFGCSMDRTCLLIGDGGGPGGVLEILREYILTGVLSARYWTATLCTCAAAVMLAVSGCTSNSSFPSPSISAALTPQESDLREVAEQGAAQTSKSDDDEAKGADNVGETKLALASSGSEAPSVKAATSIVETDGAAVGDKAGGEKPVKAAPDKSAKTEAKPSAETAEESSQSAESQSGESTKPRGLFASLFQNSVRKPKRDVGEKRVATVQRRAPRVRIITRKRGSTSSPDRGAIFGLPGVKRQNIFDIEDEIDREEFDELIHTASIANMATRGTHGLLLQRPSVKVRCFPRALLQILKQVERRFKRTPIVISGYRNKRYNQMVRGARKSTHIRCMAADIQVKGVSKWQLAKYLRTLPGRGGVGTYCHTNSVHIDVGSKRAWYYCRRSRKKGHRKA